MVQGVLGTLGWPGGVRKVVRRVVTGCLPWGVGGVGRDKGTGAGDCCGSARVLGATTMLSLTPQCLQNHMQAHALQMPGLVFNTVLLNVSKFLQETHTR